MAVEFGYPGPAAIKLRKAHFCSQSHFSAIYSILFVKLRLRSKVTLSKSYGTKARSSTWKDDFHTDACQ